MKDERHTQALAVSCVYCGAKAGGECATRNGIIYNQPAHDIRMKLGRLLASKRTAKRPTNPRTVTDPSRTYGTRGWFPAANSGRCGVCWKPYKAGTLVRALSRYSLRAECCPRHPRPAR